MTLRTLAGSRAPRKSGRVPHVLAACAVALSLSAMAPAAMAAGTDPAGASDQDDAARAALFKNAKDIVARLNDGLLQIMKKADTEEFAARVTVLKPFIDQAFDMRILSANTIGPLHWNEWTEQQKSQYVAAFTAFLTASYVNQFDSYSGQTFEVIDAEVRPKGLVYVKSQLNRANNKAVQLSYLVANRNNKQGIIDVFFDNVSEVARRRSELAGVYVRHGFDALLQTLNNKTEQLAAGTSDDAATLDKEDAAPASAGAGTGSKATTN